MDKRESTKTTSIVKLISTHPNNRTMNNEQISEVGQPDAERQSCVLTSAYSCLALKNHPTFGVKKHHVEIVIGSIFADRNEGKVGTDVVPFS